MSDVDLDWAMERARKKADFVIAHCYPEDRREEPAAKERWQRAYHAELCAIMGW